MERDPENIRADIEATQARMSDTAEALAYKADLPSRAREAISERVETVKGSVADGVASVSRNPLGIAIGAVAVGFLAGLVLPVSDLERDRVGPVGEQLTENAKSAAASAIEQGKAAVSQAVTDALSGTSSRQA